METKEDTIKQVIVMRTDLGMRKGKMIAQGAHASMRFLTNWFNTGYHRTTGYKMMSVGIKEQEEEWLRGKFTKICVRADSELELLEIIHEANQAKVEVNPVYDAGLTEFGGKTTLTCCAIGPDYSSKIDPITGNLKLL